MSFTQQLFSISWSELGFETKKRHLGIYLWCNFCCALMDTVGALLAFYLGNSLPGAVCSLLGNYKTHKGPTSASPGNLATSRDHIWSLVNKYRLFYYLMHYLEIQHNKRKENFSITHLHHIAISQTYLRRVTFWTALTKWDCHGYSDMLNFLLSFNSLGRTVWRLKCKTIM